jgi:hypothetical protein
MTIAYLDCFAGVSGDMTLGAMIDAGLSLRRLRSELKKLPVDGYTLSATSVVKKGVTATKLTVTVKKSAMKGHRHYSDIVAMIEQSTLAEPVKATALAIFHTVAVAESAVHNAPIEKVHFHEVGAVDSIVDIVGAAIGYHALGITTLYVSPVNVGSGTVNTAHGILPVPAPATALILRGIPTYAAGDAKELTTPTGAAIVKTLATCFGPQPPMVIATIGTGAGGYDLTDRANTLRLSLGAAAAAPQPVDALVELETAIDDMNPQRYGDLSEKLFAAGALDVTLTPTQMKKGRPGVIVAVLSTPATSGQLLTLLLAETTTLGVRRRMIDRISLPRRFETVATSYGPVTVKIATLPDGTEKSAPEYDSVLKVANTHNVPFEWVYRAAHADSPSYP